MPKVYSIESQFIRPTHETHVPPEEGLVQSPYLLFLSSSYHFLHFYDIHARNHLNVFTVKLQDGSLVPIKDYKISGGLLYVLTEINISVFRLLDYSLAKTIKVIDEVLGFYFLDKSRLLLVPSSGNLLEIYDLKRELRRFIVFEKKIEPQQGPVLQGSQNNQNLSCLMLHPEELLYVLSTNFSITEVDLSIELELK